MAQSKNSDYDWVQHSIKIEKMAREDFTSGIASNLASCVGDSQSLFQKMLRLAMEQLGHGYQQQAILALAQHAYKLSRCAYLTLSAGYAPQTFPTIRALYERLAIAIHARSDEELARKLVEGNAKDRDLKRYASRVNEGIPPLFNEYLTMRERNTLSQPDMERMGRTMSSLYGTFSDFAHPKKDAHGWYFAVDESTHKVVVFYYPDREATPLTIMALMLVWIMQISLQNLLVVEFGVKGEEDWDAVVHRWEQSVVAFNRQLNANMELAHQYSTWFAPNDE